MTQLHDSPHALWAALYYSAQHKFDYWLRHMPPAEVGDAAARIDAARSLIPSYSPECQPLLLASRRAAAASLALATKATAASTRSVTSASRPTSSLELASWLGLGLRSRVR